MVIQLIFIQLFILISIQIEIKRSNSFSSQEFLDLNLNYDQHNIIWIQNERPLQSDYKNWDYLNQLYEPYDIQFKTQRAKQILFESQLIFIYKQESDISCLQQVPGGNKKSPIKYIYPNSDLNDLEQLISWINQISKINIDEKGVLNMLGQKIKQIEKNINDQNQIKMKEIPTIQPKDFTIDKFINNYLVPQKPVLIKGLTQNWIKENMEILEESLNTQKNQNVHVKATKNGLFEGAEDINLWNDPDFEEPPIEIKQKLADQNKVLVRPLGIDVPLGDAIECMKKGGSYLKYKGQTIRDSSFYIEYLDITSYLPKLQEKLDNLLQDYRKILKKEKKQFWLGAGGTTSNFHFDPFENFMTVLKGKKTFRLIEPSIKNNEKLKEGHLREAIWKIEQGNLVRKQYLESTSIVNTPLQQYDDFEVYSITIEEGDVLYLPAWYWHEVYSEKSQQKDGISMAINFWFSPLFQKQFPCSNCKFEFNQIDYQEILEQQIQEIKNEL